MQPTPGYDELSSIWTRLHRLSHLQSLGLICVERREIRIVDRAGLRALLSRSP